MPDVALGEVAEINPRAGSMRPDDTVSFVGLAELDHVSAVAVPRGSRPYAEVATGYTVFRDKDILAAKITPSWENGKVGQARLDHHVGAGSTEFHVVRPGNRLDARYVLHFLRQPRIRDAGTIRMTGSAGQRRVPAKFLQELQIPLPPMEEQRRIAAILDAADGIRAKRRAVLAHLDTLTQSLFAINFLEGGAWVAHWPMGRIGDLARTVDYGTAAKAGPDGEWPVLRMGNLTDDGRLDLSDLKYLDLRDTEIAKYTVRPGDMLFNRTNSVEKVGKSAVIRSDMPLAYAGYLIRVRFDNAATAEFVAAYLNSEQGRAVRRRMAKAAVNQANINATEMRGVPIALPDSRTLTKFADGLGAIDLRRNAATRALAADDELFGSLQARAFSGKL